MSLFTVEEAADIHRRIVARSGGSEILRDRGLPESALAQPNATFGGEALYPTVVDRAAALGFFIAKNHAFVDGNKRLGQALMEIDLVLDGFEIVTTVDDQEAIFLRLAAGEIGREEFTAWLRGRVVERAR